MIKAIVFNGGLGNQMFQYAFYLQLKQKKPLGLFVFDIGQTRGVHNGFELDKIFGIDSSAKAKAFRRMKIVFPGLLAKSPIINQRFSLKYDPDVFKTRHSLFTRYEGFWQSEKYFQDVKNRVRDSFRFNISLLNDSTKRLFGLLKSGNFISVHIRRGDYVGQQNFFGLCEEDYYRQAIDFMVKKTDRPIFVFFSDDMNWVKERFHYHDAIFADWNHDSESWQDMFLMSQCSHNILANSTFSWWGGWLNENPKKIVVAPERWFAALPNYDVLPEGWVTL